MNAMTKNYDPCMCGAEDCIECHPECFDSRGRYLPDMPENEEDDIETDDDWEPEDNPADDYIHEGYQDSKY